MTKASRRGLPAPSHDSPCCSLLWAGLQTWSCVRRSAHHQSHRLHLWHTSCPLCLNPLWDQDFTDCTVWVLQWSKEKCLNQSLQRSSLLLCCVWKRRAPLVWARSLLHKRALQVLISALFTLLTLSKSAGCVFLVILPQLKLCISISFTEISGLCCLIPAWHNLEWACMILAGMCWTSFLPQLASPLPPAQQQPISWRNQSPSLSPPARLHTLPRLLCCGVLVQELSSTDPHQKDPPPRVCACTPGVIRDHRQVFLLLDDIRFKLYLALNSAVACFWYSSSSAIGTGIKNWAMACRLQS